MQLGAVGAGDGRRRTDMSGGGQTLTLPECDRECMGYKPGIKSFRVGIPWNGYHPKPEPLRLQIRTCGWCGQFNDNTEPGKYYGQMLHVCPECQDDIAE